jgi:hypothetical protein
MDEIIFKDSKGKTKMKLIKDELIIDEKPKKKERRRKQKRRKK